MYRTYTDPSVLAGIAAGASWADPEMDPTRIDWAARQARDPLAFAPGFELVNGRPFYPHAVTGVRYGRNELGHWGPQLCADALVVARSVGHRYVLMVERDDGHGWALPGGHVDPGEDPAAAAVRELAEETCLRLPYATWQISPPRYVPDPRASDESWMVTVLARTDLGTFPDRSRMPKVAGADDAKRAAWIVADTYGELRRELACTYAGTVFPAHRALLRDALGGAR